MDGEKGEPGKSLLFRAAPSKRPENWHPMVLTEVVIEKPHFS